MWAIIIQSITIMASIFINNAYFLITCISLTLLVAGTLTSNCSSYESFLVICNRLPDTDPTIYAQRKATYLLNCQRIIENNAKYQRNESSFLLKLHCPTADVPYGQQGQLLGLRTYSISEQGLPFKGSLTDASVLPSSLNYVLKGMVTSVKDQGSCGSCWSFAGTAMYESQLLKRGFSFGLSEEAALECTSYYAPNQRENSCGGGYFPDTLAFLATVGSVLRAAYPYTAGSYTNDTGFPHTPGICNETHRIMVGNGYGVTYKGMSALQLKTLLKEYGPVMVGIYADWGLMLYGGGVLATCPANSGRLLNHAVLLVGYDDGSNSWLIKNQWGIQWGESGFGRVAYSYDCGITAIAGVVAFTSENKDPRVLVSSDQLFPKANAGFRMNVHIFGILLIIFVLLI